MGVDILFVDLDRLGDLFLPFIQDSQIDQGRFELGSQDQRFLEAFLRLVVTIHLGQELGQIIVSHEVIGIEADELP
jgi:hypothetical protein